MEFTEFSHHVITQLHQDIDGYLHACQLPNPLEQASLYAMTNGGKRVRPLLVAATYATLSPSAQPHTLSGDVRRAMMAVECLHGYSLVHDDLPCMDDDALRRGRATTHIAYGEAAALLAGDVLQTLAFEAFSHVFFGEDCQYATALSAVFAPRARRMVMGQMLDVNGEAQQLTQSALEAIHRDKTGALIEASVLMGAICAKANSRQLDAVTVFANHIGLAFQVQDDILDVVADSEQLGKPAGSDEKLDKSTYVKLLGIDAANQYAQSLFDTAKQAITAEFGSHNYLIDLADWLWQREK